MNTPDVKYSIIDPNELKKCNEIDPINKAVHFLNSCFKEELYYDFLCIISNDYTNDVNNYHFKLDNNDDSNGIFIPTFYQKNSIGKDVVIINWNKICDFPKNTLISVFIHEFVHFLDYRICSELETEFDIKFSNDIKLDTLAGKIDRLLFFWSEFRAKYFQEKYEYVDDNSYHNIMLQIKDNAEEVTSKNDLYKIPRLLGQILCWKELSRNDTDILQKLKQIKEHLDNLIEYDTNVILENFFEKKDFINQCKMLSNE